MDNYKILTDKLTSLNQGSFVTELVCIPTDEQRDKLKKGSGNPEAEMRQVNSSAGLAVNYWRAYELCHPNATIEFEWKERVPLKSDAQPMSMLSLERKAGQSLLNPNFLSLTIREMRYRAIPIWKQQSIHPTRRILRNHGLLSLKKRQHSACIMLLNLDVIFWQYQRISGYHQRHMRISMSNYLV